MADPYSALRRKTRFVFEIRYQAIPALFDRRGALITRIHESIQKRFPIWQVSQGGINWVDRTDAKPVNEFGLSLKQSYLALEGTSLQDFIDDAHKHLRPVYDGMAPDLVTLDRIGLRFLELLGRSGWMNYEIVRKQVLETLHKVPFDLPFSFKD